MYSNFDYIKIDQHFFQSVLDYYFLLDY